MPHIMFIATPLPLKAQGRVPSLGNPASRGRQATGWPGGAASRPSGAIRPGTYETGRLDCLGASPAERAAGLIDNGYTF